MTDVARHLRLSAPQRRRTVVLAAGVLTLLSAIAPAPAHAVDLFPVDDWIGDGLKGIGEIALGPLKLGAEAIAKLLASIVGALADLLIPKALVEEGIGAIRWLVQLPELGTPAGTAAAPVRMPHLEELRSTLTWIGVTLVPLQIVVAGGRSFLSPSADADSPGEVLQRALAAALGLLAFAWLWGSATRMTGLVTESLLRLPWVAEGVERMLEALLIGGAAGTTVAASFVIPLLLTIAGAALLALMLLRIGLEVMGALVYATGGLALGVSISRGGHRLLQAWLVAATAVLILPVLWCIVFVTGAALMLDAGTTDGTGFAGLVAQLYNVGAALATFGLAIKLARTTLGHAGTAIAGLGAASRISSHSAGSQGRGAHGLATAGWATRATPSSLAHFSRNVRGGVRSVAHGTARAGTHPFRHPLSSAQAAGSAARHPVQSTQQAAQRVRNAVAAGAVNVAASAGHARVRAQRAFEQPSSGDPAKTPALRPGVARTPGQQSTPPQTRTTGKRKATARQPTGGLAQAPADRPAVRHTGGQSPAPRPTAPATKAAAWRTARRVAAPKRASDDNAKPAKRTGHERD